MGALTGDLFGRRTLLKGALATAAASLVALYLPHEPTGEALLLPDTTPKKLWLLDGTMLVPREKGLAVDTRPFALLDPPLIWDTRWDHHVLLGDTYFPAPNARLKPQYRDTLAFAGLPNPTYLEYKGSVVGLAENYRLGGR